MKILYLTYSHQSGVIRSLSSHLEKLGHEVVIRNVAGNLNYRYKQIKLPKVSIFNIVNSFQSYKSFGRKWKSGYLRTEFAFKHMTEVANSIILNSKNVDIVLSVIFFLNDIYCYLLNFHKAIHLVQHL